LGDSKSNLEKKIEQTAPFVASIDGNLEKVKMYRPGANRDDDSMMDKLTNTYARARSDLKKWQDEHRKVREEAGTIPEQLQVLLSPAQ